MSIKTEPFISWLKQIPGELYKLDEKPLLGFPPEFPWAAFSENIAKSLQINNLTIYPGNLQWRAAPELYDGLGDHLKTLSLSVAPLSGLAWWVMHEQGISQIMHSLLSFNTQIFSEAIDEDFFKAFNHFIAAEVINSFENIEFDKKLAPSLLRETTLPADACLCQDISIKLGDKTIYGRLLMSQEFRKSWVERYSQEQKGLALSSPLADSLNVLVHLEAGKVQLKPSEWKQIVPGDFVILDTCSLDPNEDKGRVMLVINGTPFFRAKIKQGSLKILEHPLYHEVDTTMGIPPKKNEDDDENFDTDLNDSDFDIDDDSEHTEHTEEHSEFSEFDDHTTESTEYDTEHTEHTEHTELDDSFGDEDLEESNEKKVPATGAIKVKQPEAGAKTTISNTPLSVDDIPLSVVIEVGRIQMSVKKLLELQPGNMLELDIHPDSGIDMVVNGRRIARGELLKIGDALGIRILELS